MDRITGGPARCGRLRTCSPARRPPTAAPCSFACDGRAWGSATTPTRRLHEHHRYDPYTHRRHIEREGR